MEQTRFAKIWEPIDFTVYFSFVKWPVLAALILEIIWRWRFNGSPQLELFVWIIRVVVFLFLGWLSVRKFGLSIPVAALAGAISGLIIGLLISFSRFFGGLAIWKFFNLITETTLITLAGVLVTVVAVFILRFRKKLKY